MGPVDQVALVAPPAFPLCAHARGPLVNRWCQYEPHALPHLPVNTYVNSAEKLEERFSRGWRTAVRSLAAMKEGSPCQCQAPMLMFVLGGEHRAALSHSRQRV